MSHSSKILFTCIWKVPLDYFDEPEDGTPEHEEAKDGNTNMMYSSKLQGPNAKRDWSSEQLEIIQSLGPENSWKFYYDSVVEYCLSQNSLHERCQKMARLGYRVDQIVGIQHNFISRQTPSSEQLNSTQRMKLG